MLIVARSPPWHGMVWGFPGPRHRMAQRDQVSNRSRGLSNREGESNVAHTNTVYWYTVPCTQIARTQTEKLHKVPSEVHSHNGPRRLGIAQCDILVYCTQNTNIKDKSLVPGEGGGDSHRTAGLSRLRLSRYIRSCEREGPMPIAQSRFCTNDTAEKAREGRASASGRTPAKEGRRGGRVRAKGTRCMSRNTTRPIIAACCAVL